MDIKQYLSVTFLLILSCISYDSFGQNLQIIKAELTKDGTTESVCLVDDTDVDNVDVFDDQLVVKRLPGNQSGYVEFTVNDFFNSEIIVRLEEENNPSIHYDIRFVNSTVVYDGTTTQFYQNGDEFRITRCGAEINFEHNGVVIAQPNPVTNGNFDQPLVVMVDVISTAGEPTISLEFPHLIPHCVPDSQMPDNKDNFIAAKKHLDGSYARAENQQLKFWYKERYAIANGINSAVEYKVYDWQKNEILSGSLVNCYGPNWHQIELTALAANEFYTLELKGANKGETYYIRFENL